MIRMSNSILRRITVGCTLDGRPSNFIRPGPTRAPLTKCPRVISSYQPRKYERSQSLCHTDSTKAGLHSKIYIHVECTFGYSLVFLG